MSRRAAAAAPRTHKNNGRGDMLFGDDLVATPYWQRMEKGKELLGRGQARQAMDAFLECIVHLSPAKWINERYNNLCSIFIIFYSTKGGKCKELMTTKDVKLLKTKLVDNEEEPFLFRYKTCLELAGIMLRRGKTVGCLELGKQAIELYEQLWGNSNNILLQNKIMKAMRPDTGGPSVVCRYQDLVHDMDDRLAMMRKMVHMYSQQSAMLSGDISSQYDVDLVLSNPNKMAELRFMHFQNSCAMLGQAKGSNPHEAKEGQQKLKEKMIDNQDEPNLFRCQAICTMAAVKWHEGDKEAWATYRNQARLLMNQTTNEHLTQVTRGLRNIAKKEGSIPCDATVAEFYEDMEEIYLADCGPLKPIEAATLSNLEIRNILAREELDMPTFCRRMVQGGDDCDVCGKEKEALGVSRLEACGTCKNAFYCSRECQKKHWKSGHKDACRVKGDIRNGDLVKLRKLKRKDLNRRVVKVAGPDPDNEGRWLVSFFDDSSDMISVLGEKLDHIRSLG